MAKDGVRSLTAEPLVTMQELGYFVLLSTPIDDLGYLEVCCKMVGRRLWDHSNGRWRAGSVRWEHLNREA